VDQETLKKYQGKYQFTDVPKDKVTVSYKGKDSQMNWQERGHFGTIKPYFKALSTYAQGLSPIVVGTPKYNQNLVESQRYGSNDKKSKDSYNYNTPSSGFTIGLTSPLFGLKSAALICPLTSPTSKLLAFSPPWGWAFLRHAIRATE